jgi:hypothetical protein
MVAGGVLQAGLVRVTVVNRRNTRTGIPENFLGWKVRADDPEAAAALFCRRFLPSDHQGSRRA